MRKAILVNVEVEEDVIEADENKSSEAAPGLSPFAKPVTANEGETLVLSCNVEGRKDNSEISV